jgi:hypothetical protein
MAISKRRFNTWTGDTTPASGRSGQIWINTSNDSISRYNGSSWIPVGVSANEIISQITGSAPATLDTLDEIAAALNGNPDILDLYLTSTSASTAYAPKTWVDPTSATNGQVLTANGSGGSSFQTPSAGGFSGLVLLRQVSVNNQSSISIDNIFTDTYNDYVLDWHFQSNFYDKSIVASIIDNTGTTRTTASQYPYTLSKINSSTQSIAFQQTNISGLLMGYVWGSASSGQTYFRNMRFSTFGYTPYSTFNHGDSSNALFSGAGSHSVNRVVRGLNISAQGGGTFLSGKISVYGIVR